MVVIRAMGAAALGLLAAALSYGPLFVVYGWFVGADIWIRGGLRTLVLNTVAAGLAWYGTSRVALCPGRRAAVLTD